MRLLSALIRPDGTEKPEADVMRAFAATAKSMGEHLREPERPAIAVVTSQAAQFSVLGDLQLEAQRKAVRALAIHRPPDPICRRRESTGQTRIAPAGDLALAPSAD